MSDINWSAVSKNPVLLREYGIKTIMSISAKMGNPITREEAEKRLDTVLEKQKEKQLCLEKKDSDSTT